MWYFLYLLNISFLSLFDKVSQRLMVLNKEKGEMRMNGMDMAKLIVNQEGFKGLWKGFFTSIGKVNFKM